MSVFSERLRKERDKLGVKQSDISALLGVSVQSYSAYETGREPKYDLLCKLANHFGVTTDYLLGKSSIPAGNVDDMAIEERLHITKPAINNLEIPTNHRVEGIDDDLLPYQKCVDLALSSEKFRRFICSLATYAAMDKEYIGNNILNDMINHFKDRDNNRRTKEQDVKLAKFDVMEAGQELISDVIERWNK